LKRSPNRSNINSSCVVEYPYTPVQPETRKALLESIREDLAIADFRAVDERIPEKQTRGAPVRSNGMSLTTKPQGVITQRVTVSPPWSAARRLRVCVPAEGFVHEGESRSHHNCGDAQRGFHREKAHDEASDWKQDFDPRRNATCLLGGTLRHGAAVTSGAET
jgi:hypothetical protein